jgi:hypothetical protein
VIRKAWEAFASLEAFLALSALLAGVLAADAFHPSRAVHSHPAFAVLLALLGLNLAACTAVRFRRLPWTVLLVHVAVIVVLAGGAVAWKQAQRGRMTLRTGDAATREVLDEGGRPLFALPFALRLEAFRVEYDREPLHRLTLKDPERKWTRTLDVAPGGMVPVPGTPWTLAVGRFIPDLVVGENGVEKRSDEPRNPALQVAFLEDGKPCGGAWVFAFFPGMHQDDLPLAVAYEYEPPPVRQYASRVTLTDAGGRTVREGEISVNHPLRHAGWALYQSGYDPADPRVSVIEAARDPGVPLVYAGFILLMIGLTSHFLRRVP